MFKNYIMIENSPLQDKDRDHRHVGESISTTALHHAYRRTVSNATSMHLLFKSAVSEVAIINPDDAIILMKEVFLFSFPTFLQSFH